MKAFEVAVDHQGLHFHGITFALSRGAARFNLIRALWENYGRSDEFPNVRARRAPECDRLSNVFPRSGVYDMNYVREQLS